MAGAHRFHSALARADLAPFRAVMLPVPDINIVCYLLCHPSLTTLPAVNQFNERVYARMSLTRSDGRPQYCENCQKQREESQAQHNEHAP